MIPTRDALASLESLTHQIPLSATQHNHKMSATTIPYIGSQVTSRHKSAQRSRQVRLNRCERIQLARLVLSGEEWCTHMVSDR
jgi:hypothetical protein